MTRAVLALAPLAMVALLAGCGTFFDGICGPVDGHVFYRGVRYDVSVVEGGGVGVLMAADIPFSAVVDTVKLPFDAYDLAKGPPEPEFLDVYHPKQFLDSRETKGSASVSGDGSTNTAK